MILTVGLAGLFMSVAIDLVIVFGKDQYDNVAIGSTMGLVAFSLMLVVAAFECRDQTGSILHTETFDNTTVNITALVEIALALMIARGGALTSLLNTQTSPAGNGSSAPFPRWCCSILWELGKLIARRGTPTTSTAIPAGATAPDL